MNTQETEFKDLIQNLSQLHSITPSKRFRFHVKNALIPSLPVKQAFSHSLFFGFSARIAALVLVFLLFGTSGLVLAASESKPGSLLYPIKQVVQDAKLAIATNPTAKALLHLEKAQDKVEEMQQAVFDTKTEHFEQNVQEYKESINKAVEETKEVETQKEDTAQTVNESLEKHTETLQQLQTIAPTQAQPALEKAIDASQKGQQQVQEVIQNNPSNTNQPPPQNSGNFNNQNIGRPTVVPAQPQSGQNQNSNSNSSFGQEKANEHKGR